MKYEQTNLAMKFIAMVLMSILTFTLKPVVAKAEEPINVVDFLQPSSDDIETVDVSELFNLENDDTDTIPNTISYLLNNEEETNLEDQERSSIPAEEIIVEEEIEPIEYEEMPHFDFSNEGYINENSVNVRAEPNVNCEIIRTYNMGDKIVYSYYENNPCFIVVQLSPTMFGFIFPEFVQDELPYRSIKVGGDRRKSYMGYTAITKKSSPQYRLQHSEGTYTGDYGCRMNNDRYIVAAGSAVAKKMGTYFDAVLDNGTVIPCILGDQKANQHTDASNLIGGDGSTIEFIIDSGALLGSVRQSGNLNSACSEWNSRVVEIRVYDIIADF